MNILQAIKSKRKLTFGHWRYRLLHWTFGEKATSPEKSTLPSFLYTHYCPLFHITNVLLLLSPVTFLLKLLVLSFSYIGKFLDYVSPKVKSVIPKRVVSDKEQLLKQLHFLVTEIEYTPNLFDTMYESYKDTFPKSFDKETVKKYFELLYNKYAEREKEKQARKQARYNLFVRLASVGSLLVKGLCILAYLFLIVSTIGIFTTLTLAVFPYIVSSAIFCFYNLDIIFLGVLAVTVFGGATGFIGYHVYKSEWFGKFLTKTENVMTADLTPPGGFIKMAATNTADGVYDFFGGIKDFFSVLYEDNCPPIEIVTGEEAEIINAIEEN